MPFPDINPSQITLSFPSLHKRLKLWSVSQIPQRLWQTHCAVYYYLQATMCSAPWLLLPFLLIARSQVIPLTPPPIAPTPPPLPPGCYESTFTSTHTRCELTFLYCYNFVKLSQCLMRKCERYIRAGDCRLETSFILEE